MKKILFTLLGCMVLASCNNEVEQMVTNFEEQHDVLSVNEEENSNVTLADIQAYMDKGSDIASRNGGDGEIEVVTYQNDTVMYLLKYADGWEMMPSDKRFPLRVAYNDEGTLDYANMHDAQRAWFESIAEEIHVMKKHGKGIENEYCKVWNALTKKNKKKDNHKSRSENGEWILHNTREVVSIEEISHLISTNWAAWSERSYSGKPDFNMYCPIDSILQKHDLVAYAAVCGAQVLYHFHKLWGIPATMPRNAVYIDGEYQFGVWDSSQWTEIAKGDTNVDNGMEAIALLLGHVNSLCGPVGSDPSAYSDLPYALGKYGIGCSRMQTWDNNIIRNNINSNRPIIGDITGTMVDTSVRNTLIIDGYKYISTTYTDVYIYINEPGSYTGDMYDHDESGNPVPEEGPSQEETYTINDMYYMVKWGSGYVDNTYYLSYNPINYDYGSGIGIVPYNRNKKMLYDFYIK